MGLSGLELKPSAVRIRRLTARDTVHPLQEEEKVEVICRHMLPDFQKRTNRFVKSQTAPVLCRSSESNMQVKTSMEYWWNDTKKEELKCSKNTHPCANLYGINFTLFGM